MQIGISQKQILKLVLVMVLGFVDQCDSAQISLSLRLRLDSLKGRMESN